MRLSSALSFSMAPPLVSQTPQCMSCIRRMIGSCSLGDASWLSNGQQKRGKKRLAKVSTVKVHLLQNIPGYGRKGAVIPVTAGVMRNIWYPKKMADYLTAAKLQKLGIKKDTVIERDTNFRSNTERKLRKQDEEKAEEIDSDTNTAQSAYEPAPEQIAPVELDLLGPEQATSVLEKLLPANMDFYRTPITISQPLKRVSPSIPATSAVSEAARDAKDGMDGAKPGKTNIYGSVSTADIAANLKAVLAEDNEGARVVLSPEDIYFVEETDDKDRVKHLGVFKIEIRLSGASESVQRTIMVNAQD